MGSRASYISGAGGYAPKYGGYAPQPANRTGTGNNATATFSGPLAGQNPIGQRAQPLDVRLELQRRGWTKDPVTGRMVQAKPSQTIAPPSVTGARPPAGSPGGGIGFTPGGGSSPSQVVRPPSQTLTPSPGAGGGASPNSPGGGAGVGAASGQMNINSLASEVNANPATGFAAQFSPTSYKTLLSNPSTLTSAYLEGQGIDSNSAMGGMLGQEAGMIYALGEILGAMTGGEQGRSNGPAELINIMGGLSADRARPGGMAYDEQLLASLLDPQSDGLQMLLGQNSQLTPEQQMSLARDYIGAAMDAGLTPGMGTAAAMRMNAMQDDYLLHAGREADPMDWIDYLSQNSGLGSALGF